MWPLPLAALAGRRGDGSDSSGGGCGGGGGHGGGGAPRLTHLDISRTAVPAEQLEELQVRTAAVHVFVCVCVCVCGGMYGRLYCPLHSHYKGTTDF